jgi:valyl-tRNA synthetase
MEQLPTAYEPKETEAKWSRLWEQLGLFTADASSKKPPYTVVMPPPNVTGVLHMGHALVSTLQDVLIRWKRMCGFEVLWVPGTDHAGIATQAVVERSLLATTGKRRRDLPRDEFVRAVWTWKEESEKTIISQLRRVGCSCDWSRYAFTMDPPRSRAVAVMFEKMFQAGLIYRGDYLVNWDPVTMTALADDEVEYEERETSLWFINYPLDGQTGSITIATTRPETLLGDVAVAVSPSDPRYEALIGKKVLLPIQNRLIPIIGDSAIDATFGTGAVKVTPAHDPVDYEIGLRHALPLINIFTPDGKVSSHGKPFEGLTKEEARHAVVERLKTLKLLVKIEPHRHRVGLSYRSKAVIEPLLSKQWFVKLSAFKNSLIQLVRSKTVHLFPPSFEATYLHWIHNLRDWCISRQLWWGHRIPIWYRKGRPDEMICHIGEGTAPNPAEWTQDDDVLDTWFSSALWPLSTLGWPDTTPDFEKFYPTSTLVTGHDILFFWVARMMMMGEYATGKAPFSDVFLHGLIYGKSYWRLQADGTATYLSSQDRVPYELGQAVPPEVHSKWEKMSKSKGNVLDPLEIIDAYGADAMRIALCSVATTARQIDLDRRRFEEYKNFANKVWNGARFVFLHLEDLSFDRPLPLKELALEDRWILSRMNRTIQETHAALTEYAFDKAAGAAYNFFWNEFCADYVELAKPTLFGKAGDARQKEIKQRILFIVLSNSLRLLHPMAPFITEELFSHLTTTVPASLSPSLDPYTAEAATACHAAACAAAPFPMVTRPHEVDDAVEDEFKFVRATIQAIRTIRAEMQLPPSTPTDLYCIAPHPLLHRLEAQKHILSALVRLRNLHFTDQEPSLSLAATAFAEGIKLMVPLPAEMRERERARLSKEQARLIAQGNAARQQLSNPDFLAKAPPALIDRLKETAAKAERELLEVAHKLEELQK